MITLVRTISCSFCCAIIFFVTRARAEEPLPNDSTQKEAPAVEPTDPLSLHRLPLSVPSQYGGATRSFDSLSSVPDKPRRHNNRPFAGNWAVGWALMSTGAVGVLSAVGFRALNTQGSVDIFHAVRGPNTDNPEPASFSQVAYPAIMGVTSGALLAIGAGLVIRHLTRREESLEMRYIPKFQVSVGPTRATSFGVRYTW